MSLPPSLPLLVPLRLVCRAIARDRLPENYYSHRLQPLAYERDRAA